MDNPPGEPEGNPAPAVSHPFTPSESGAAAAGGKRSGQPLLWAISLNAILFGLFLTGATLMYETNDDLVMQRIASGFYTGHPDEHLVFTNILIGRVLRFFYEAWPRCNWYLAYLLAVHFAALTAIAFVGLSRRRTWWFGLLYAGFFLIVETHLLLQLQFTTTAFLAGTAGLLLLVDGLRPGLPVQGLKVAAGIMLVGLMSMIREPVAPLLALLAGPFLCERFGRHGWQRLLALISAGAGLFLILHGVNRWSYQRNAAWAEYSEYNRLRGEIHLTPLARFIPAAAPAAGWTQNDGWMFSQFYFSDPDVFGGVPRLHRLSDALKVQARRHPPSWRIFSADFLLLPDIFGRDASPLMKLALLNALACLAFAGHQWRRVLITLLTSYGVFVGVCLYLLVTARLPERVSYNIPLFLCAICFYWAADSSAAAAGLASNKIRRWAAGLLVALWTALYLAGLFQLFRSLQSAETHNRDLQRISRKILTPMQTLLPAGQTPVVIPMPFDSVLEQCLFFYPPGEKLPFVLLPYGWIVPSPVFNQLLDQQHLRPFATMLVSRPDVFFLMEPRWLDPLKTFYREHYGLDVRFDLVLNTDEMAAYADCHLHLYRAQAVPHGTSLQRVEPAPASGR